MTLDVQNEQWPISKVKPFERNARRHPKAQICQLADSIREYGQVTPILVDEAGVIIAGHGRFEACKRARRSTVWVAVARDWTDEKKRKYRLLDNALGDLSDWDREMLQMEVADIGDIQLGGMDFDFGLGFDEDVTDDNNAAPSRAPDPTEREPQDDPPPAAASAAVGAATPIRIPLLIELTPAQNKAWQAIKAERGFADNASALLALAGIE